MSRRTGLLLEEGGERGECNGDEAESKFGRKFGPEIRARYKLTKRRAAIQPRRARPSHFLNLTPCHACHSRRLRARLSSLPQQERVPHPLSQHRPPGSMHLPHRQLAIGHRVQLNLRTGRVLLHLQRRVRSLQLLAHPRLCAHLHPNRSLRPDLSPVIPHPSLQHA